jgi:KUP system potassium uptake protein
MTRDPAVLWAFDPTHIVRFFAHHGLLGLSIFGAIVLCVSGVEALYADVSHFGHAPIALAWSAVVFPALVLNYLGQGALVLVNPNALENPFYFLTPSLALYPVVAIATIATIIASQALISGVFTLTKQAISLDFIPRMRVIFTSVAHRGQVYVPFVNRLLGASCIALVLAFGSSTRLANAYGLAVAVTMLVTSIAYFEVVRSTFKWPLGIAILSTAPFFIVELLFVLGGLPKILEGGWIPILISACIFVVATTWRAGRRRVAQVMMRQSQSIKQFLRETRGRLGVPYEGTAVFLTGDAEGIPFVLRHHWARTHGTDEKIVLLTILPTNDPYVHSERRVDIEWLSIGLARVTARFGFMETISLNKVIVACSAQGLHIGGVDTTYYTADPQIVPSKGGLFKQWRRTLFVILKRNARSLTATLGIAPDAHAKLGIEVRM